MAINRVLTGLVMTGFLFDVSLLGWTQEIDRMKAVDEYEIYYNLVNSTFLDPRVAERYDLDRSENLAVLTVSVREDINGETTDQPAEVSGSVSDLVHHYPLEFEEFRDPNAVYYIAQVPAQGRTRLDFSLDVKPQDSAEVYQIEFSEPVFPPARSGSIQ